MNDSYISRWSYCGCHKSYIYIYKYIQICKSVILPVCQSVSLSVCQSVSLSVCQSVSLSVCQSVSLSVCQSVSLSVCQSVSLSVCQSVCLRKNKCIIYEALIYDDVTLKKKSIMFINVPKYLKYTGMRQLTEGRWQSFPAFS